MAAERFVAYAYRLEMYGGVITGLSNKSRQSVIHESAPRALDEPKDVRELMATDPLFQGIITAVSVPGTEIEK